jgi:hypothetical protein
MHSSLPLYYSLYLMSVGSDIIIELTFFELLIVSFDHVYRLPV